MLASNDNLTPLALRATGRGHEAPSLHLASSRDPPVASAVAGGLAASHNGRRAVLRPPRSLVILAAIAGMTAIDQTSATTRTFFSSPIGILGWAGAEQSVTDTAGMSLTGLDSEV